ncbi:MAG: transposase [Cytophagales bacterium]|nr:transposase [Cytophagales bacterium]
MSDSYQIKDQSAIYFLTFQVVAWVDIFSRKVYRDIIIESLKFCRAHKGLILYGYVIMTNHVHIIVRSETGVLSDTMRDFKRFTSRKIMQLIDENSHESRKKWMQIVFSYHAKYNKRSGNKQFWTHENHACNWTPMK